MDTPDAEQISHLRALAHPIRIRILSLLTAEAMSAAEVARALEITHANASYHLRVLAEAGQLAEAGEEEIRGGVAKRYRYDLSSSVIRTRKPSTEDRLADHRATAAEVERRLLTVATGASTFSDLEAWVPVDDWRRALDLMHEASTLLHRAALPARTPETVHVSATATAFTMTGGLTGPDATWDPEAGAR